MKKDATCLLLPLKILSWFITFSIQNYFRSYNIYDFFTSWLTIIVIKLSKRLSTSIEGKIYRCQRKPYMNWRRHEHLSQEGHVLLFNSHWNTIVFNL